MFVLLKADKGGGMSSGTAFDDVAVSGKKKMLQCEASSWTFLSLFNSFHELQELCQRERTDFQALSVFHKQQHNMYAEPKSLTETESDISWNVVYSINVKILTLMVILHQKGLSQVEISKQTDVSWCADAQLHKQGLLRTTNAVSSARMD